MAINVNHKIIIEGYKKEGFKILDPSTGKKSILDFDTFLIAFYASFPELLIIKNKS